MAKKHIHVCYDHSSYQAQGKWIVRLEGKLTPYKRFHDLGDAIQYAVQRAIRQDRTLVTFRKDGSKRSIDSFGKEAYEFSQIMGGTKTFQEWQQMWLQWKPK